MKSRFGYLDSIRGISAIIVVISHILVHKAKHLEEGQAFAKSFLNYIDMGKIGVIAFFICSGLVIPMSLNSNKENPIKGFIIGRFFRLYPAYWLSIFSAILVVSYSITTKDVLINITMMQQFLGFNNIIDVYWTLQIELIFYILCVILFSIKILHHPKTPFYLCLLSILGALGFALIRYNSSFSAPVALPLALFAMFFGQQLKPILLDADQSRRKNTLICLILFFITLPIICYLAYTDNWIRYTGTYVIAFVSFYLLCTKYKIEHSSTRFLGRVSYSLYLIHPLVIKVHYDLIVFHFPSASSLLLSSISILTISIFISWVIFRYIEEPCIKLGKRLTHKKVKEGLATS